MADILQAVSHPISWKNSFESFVIRNFKLADLLFETWLV